MLAYVFSTAPLSAVFTALVIRAGFRPEVAYADVARPWQLGFQTPASPLREGIVAFHDDLRRFLTLILCFVGYRFAVCLHRFGNGSHRPVDRLLTSDVL